MDIPKVIVKLKSKYQNKAIVLNPPEHPTEILCEIDPSSLHSDYSIAVAVIDQSRPHYHKKTEELYEVLQGDLTLTINGKDYPLKAGEQIKILPNQTHWAKGNSSWIKVTSHPGWTMQDHILVDENQIAVLTYDKIAQIYTDKYFDDKTDIPFIDKFISYLPKGCRILDVGSGPGEFAKYLLEKGFIVEGIDLSDEMLGIAQQKVPEAKFTKMDMRRLTFHEESFNGLLVAYSLIHIPSSDLSDTLKGFYRLLKQNGHILLITQRGKADQLVDEGFKPDEKMFFNFFTIERLNRILEAARFKVVFQEERRSHDAYTMSDTVIYTIIKKYEQI